MERLRSHALQQGPSPLHFFPSIPGRNLIPEGCEKEEDTRRIRKRRKVGKDTLNLIITHPYRSPESAGFPLICFKTYPIDFRKSKQKGKA